jgi:antitoxin component of RelBE/YafQ-DinJ toxin-antitoxin module
MAKAKLTTTIDEELLKKAKIECINLGINVNELLEKLLIEYFENKKKYNLGN